jgi:hypothetical protein
MQKMPKFRSRKILTLLDSSGNNLMIAMRDDTKSTKNDSKGIRRVRKNAQK